MFVLVKSIQEWFIASSAAVMAKPVVRLALRLSLAFRLHISSKSVTIPPIRQGRLSNPVIS